MILSQLEDIKATWDPTNTFHHCHNHQNHDHSCMRIHLRTGVPVMVDGPPRGPAPKACLGTPVATKLTNIFCRCLMCVSARFRWKRSITTGLAPVPSPILFPPSPHHHHTNTTTPPLLCHHRHHLSTLPPYHLTTASTSTPPPQHLHTTAHTPHHRQHHRTNATATTASPSTSKVEGFASLSPSTAS